jgi:hypothetical protein
VVEYDAAAILDTKPNLESKQCPVPFHPSRSNPMSAKNRAILGLVSVLILWAIAEGTGLAEEFSRHLQGTHRTILFMGCGLLCIWGLSRLLRHGG